MTSIFTIAQKQTLDTARTMAKDAGYIPQDKLGLSPGGCARSAYAIMTECAGFNYLAAEIIRTGAPDAAKSAEREKMKAASHAEATRWLEESAMALCGAIGALKEGDLSSTRKMPWGAEMAVAELIFLPASHMAYHDGQINYIQTLLGDDKFHWAGE